jgi:RimJ/RimL family protein N-acetyltransferase
MFGVSACFPENYAVRMAAKKGFTFVWDHQGKAARTMQIQLARAQVRSWQLTDAESLAVHANNRKIWRNLRDAFPHPYTVADASAFLQSAMARVPESWFAIAVDDQAVGGIGFTLHHDVERVSAEIGYWLGEAFWGRGITTEALQAVTRYAVQTHQLTRVFAVPYEWNCASFRVLEKAGYRLEGRLRRSAIKDGQVIDQLLYAYVVPEVETRQNQLP